MNSSSTYGFFVCLLFFKYIDGTVDSFVSIINKTDKLIKEFNCDINLSRKTKYNIINSLIDNKLLTINQNNSKISLSKESKRYFNKYFDIILK